jgi:hypothetical protein
VALRDVLLLVGFSSENGLGSRAMIEEIFWEDEGVPAWLESPATEIPAVIPPVDTRVQLLPFGDLAWGHFERLGLRYIRTRASIVRAQLYGVRGQKQHGIDFYVRLSDPPRHEVYQCKRLESFTGTDVKKAVDKFLDGKWHDQSKAFRIMTSHLIEETQIADAIEMQAQRLDALGIEFEVIGRERLSEALKDHPRIVDDFFSRSWVEAFCGGDAARLLGRRMNGEKVAEYRVRLNEFYRMIFNRHDPGIPVPTQIGEVELQLRDRFVVPDVYGSLGTVATAGERAERSTSEKTSSSDQADAMSHERREATSVGEIKIRVDVDRWLSQGNRFVILGGPGSGKSALLRTLVIELLSPEPVFPQAAAQWGALLPVWVPFSFWTTLNTRLDTSIGLADCLAIWLRQHGQERIWPLVEAAIEDERLLLLVDGLDEWTDETAAKTTSNLLQAFIHINNLPAVLASRPHGFERVGVLGAEWQLGTLAPMKQEQQRKLVVKWLAIDRFRKSSIEAKDLARIESDEAIGRESSEFIQKLTKSTDLLQLAEVPLTLLLLLYLHLQNSPLPSSRFEAYAYVADHFIRKHPSARRTAAALTSDPDGLTPKEIQNGLAYMAYMVQTDFPSGILSATEVERRLEDFLQHDAIYGLSLPREAARKILRSFTNLEEGSLGLLVSQGQSNLSFFHRSLQEYLAAVHLARTPLSKHKTVIQERLADARWREVIVGMVYLCRRDEEAGALVDAIESADVDAIGNLSKEDILAEIAFRETNLTAAKTRTLAERACAIIETSFIPSQRSRLLNHAMSGLNSRKTSALVQDRIRRWTFSRGMWGAGRVEYLRFWPATDHSWAILFRLMHDEDPSVMRAASDVISHVFAGSGTHGDTLAEMALNSQNPNQRAAAIESLAKGWPAHPLMHEILSQGNRSVSLEVKTATLLSKVVLAQHQDRDFYDLLTLAVDRFHSGLEYSWRLEITNALVRGWAGDQRLKTVCLVSWMDHTYQSSPIDRDIALAILGKAFPQDDDVASALAEHLKQDHDQAFSSSDAVWVDLRKNFRDHELIVKALDEWATKLKDHDVLALRNAALVGRTPIMKAALIKNMEEWDPFWAVGALLEGWGMNDPEVAQILTDRLGRADACEIAQYVPRILGDPEAARARLLALLTSPESHRIDLVLHGFAELKPSNNRKEIVDAVVPLLSDVSGYLIGSPLGALILAFPEDERVKALALEALRSPYPPLGAMVEAYASDEQFRVQVGEALTPLSANLRFQIVSDLPVFSEKSFALKVLRDWDAELNVEVKTQASIQYHTLLMPGTEEAETALTKLDGMLPSYGPDHDARRQAAAAGLIVFRALHRVVGKVERIGFEGKPVNIPINDGSKSNRVFLNLLAANWSYIKHALAGDLSILASRIGPSQLWQRLAMVAGDYPTLTKEIVEVAETAAELRRSAEFIALLSRIEPRSENLVALCLSVFGGDGNWHGWFDTTEAAAAIVAGQFRGDTNIEARLLSLIRPDHISLGVIMALSLGWRQSDMLRRIDFRRRRREVGSAELYAKYACIPLDHLPNALEKDLIWAQHNGFQSESIIRPLISRLNDDAQAREAISTMLFSNSNPSVKASFSKLLARSGGSTPELDGWCRRELKQQSLPNIPEIGYDLFARSARAVSLCLLESLGEVTTADALGASDLASG